MMFIKILVFANKKVLLRERKRHTACRVPSTHYAVPVGGGTYLAGGYLPWPGGTYPGWGWYLSWPGGYLPWLGVPTLAGRVPTLAGGYLPWPGGYLPWLGGVPTLAGGYLPWLGGTYPGQGGNYPCQGVTYPGWGGTYLGWGGTYHGRYPPRPDLGR